MTIYGYPRDASPTADDSLSPTADDDGAPVVAAAPVAVPMVAVPVVAQARIPVQLIGPAPAPVVPTPAAAGPATYGRPATEPPVADEQPAEGQDEPSAGDGSGRADEHRDGARYGNATPYGGGDSYGDASSYWGDAPVAPGGGSAQPESAHRASADAPWGEPADETPAGGASPAEPAPPVAARSEPFDTPTRAEPVALRPGASTPAEPTDGDAGAPSQSWRDVEIPLDDEPEIVPWDRRPLMIALAAVATLVLIGVVSGIATSAYFGHGPTWQAGGGTRPTPTPSASAPAGGPAGSTDTVTLSGVGDVIMGTLPGDIPPNGGQGFFDPVNEALDADLVMGNLETPLTQNTGYSKCAPPAPGEQSNCFQFYLDPSYARYLKDGGFDLVNLANNHTNDMGPTGLRNTRTALDAAGVKYTGAKGQVTYVDVRGVKVAVLGFSPFSASDRNLLNISAAQAVVRDAAAKADLVVIQMQGGAEGSDQSHVRPGTETFGGENRGDLVKFTHAVVDAGADVVFGHGPHIMRGMEFYHGRLIAYSLGNFCGYGVLNSNGYLGVGGVLKVSLHRDGSWAGGTLVPTEMVRGGMVAVDEDKRALGFVDGLSKSDFGGHAVSVDGTTGKITPPAS